MHIVKIITKVKQESGTELERTEYEQSVDNLDVQAVIAVVNGLQKPAPKVEEPQ